MAKVLQFPKPRRTRSAKHASATLLQFPVQFACPTCGKPCSEDDLSECLTCGQQYCSHPACDWTCACDHMAADLAQRVSMVLNETFPVHTVQKETGLTG